MKKEEASYPSLENFNIVKPQLSPEIKVTEEFKKFSEIKIDKQKYETYKKLYMNQRVTTSEELVR
jgi:hypothetical protein